MTAPGTDAQIRVLHVERPGTIGGTIHAAQTNGDHWNSLCGSSRPRQSAQPAPARTVTCDPCIDAMTAPIAPSPKEGPDGR